MKSLLRIAVLSAASAPVAAQQHGDPVRELARALEQLSYEKRSIDGSGNHLQDHERGAAFTPFIRQLTARYADGYNAPAGERRASARHISNMVAATGGDTPNASGLSDMFWQWGQFLDHDITETPIQTPEDPLPIPVPRGDVWFDPLGTGAVEISMSRSAPVRSNGIREQINAITAWIDGSQVYGSEEHRADALRAFDGEGHLATSAGDLLPFNIAGLPNAPSSSVPSFFLAGDFRANEQVGLTALHVVFVREHNHWCDMIREADERRRSQGSSADPMTGDEIYELARAIVAAELQRITYREWLPLLLGEDVLGGGSQYRPELNGAIRNEFATAAFRLGHSMLSETLLRLDENGDEIAAGHLPLADAFFAPEEIIADGVDPILRGLLSQRAQELDAVVVDAVRNFLFGPPGAGGFDLASLNIQRGRDHGLPTLGEARRELGLGEVTTWADITSDPALQAKLAAAARTPEDLDLWVGGLAEDDVPGSIVGPTFHALLRRQFEALRDGDRLWYRRQLPPDLIEIVEQQDLERILRRTTGLSRQEVRRPFLAD